MNRQSLAVAMTVLGVALVPASGAGAAQTAGSGLVAFALAANAPGLAIEGLYKDVGLTIPETNSTLSTGGVGTGFAAVAWPGPIVGNLGTTILVLESGAPAGVTVLNSPVRAESHSGGVERPTYGTSPGPVMSSTATQTAVTAASNTGTGTTLPVGTVGAITGASSTVLRGATGGVSTASSEVSDISLAGGVISIGGVRSTATTTTDGSTSTATGSTAVTRMTVAGVPVSVDGQGLHVAESNLPNPLPQETLNNAIKALGLSVLLTSPTVVKSGPMASYSAGALVLLYTQGADHYAFTLGRASASVSVSKSFAQPVLPPPGTTPPVTTQQPLPVPQAHVPQQLAGGIQSSLSGLTPAIAPVGAQPPSRPVVLVPAAFSDLLAGGAPALLLIPLLLVVGLLGWLLQRVPERFLAVVGDVMCGEQQG